MTEGRKDEEKSWKVRVEKRDWRKAGRGKEGRRERSKDDVRRRQWRPMNDGTII